MKSYNVKCKGCGIYLNDDPSSLGYAKNFKPNITKYCKRCFDIKNYHKCETTTQNLAAIQATLDGLDLTDYLVIVVLDVLDLQNSLIEQYQNHPHVVYVVNKMDLLPSRHQRELTVNHIVENLEALHYQFQDIIFCSTKSRSSIKVLDEYLKNQPFKKMIVLGKSNTGKSSLIKALCALNKVDEHLIVSSYLNTTNDLNKVKVNKYYQLIDTPGFINNHSMLNFLALKDIKKIHCENTHHAKNFQIYESRTFKLENLVTINVYPYKNACLTFYIQDNLHLEACKLKPSMTLAHQSTSMNYSTSPSLAIRTFDFSTKNTKVNIAISGIGLLSFKNLEKIEILVHKDVNVNVLTKLLI